MAMVHILWQVQALFDALDKDKVGRLQSYEAVQLRVQMHPDLTCRTGMWDLTSCRSAPLEPLVGEGADVSRPSCGESRQLTAGQTSRPSCFVSFLSLESCAQVLAPTWRNLRALYLAKHGR